MSLPNITNSLQPFMLRLEPMLAAAKRGEAILANDIERTSGATFERLVQKIIRWFKRHRGVRASRRGESIYLMTAAEQGCHMPVNDLNKLRRATGRALGLVAGVNPADLDTQKERDTQEHHARILAAHYAAAAGASKEAAFVLSGNKNTNRLGA